MRVLVTGGSGFIGTNLVKQLCDKGDNVISLDNYSSGYKENFAASTAPFSQEYSLVSKILTRYLNQI